jgi:hypothetical protein
MANKNPSHKFEKGNKFGGRKPLSKETIAARSLSYEQMILAVIDVRNLTNKDIENINQDEIPMGKRAIIKAYTDLDYKAIKDYEDRLWGKAKETIDVDVDMEDRKIEVEHTLNIQGDNSIAEILGILVESGAIASATQKVTTPKID